MNMIDEIRQKLPAHNIDAYVVSYGNRFIGQDILPCEHKLKYLCGFSGSAGIAVVTTDKAFLLVDGRYELQAKLETNPSEITVVGLQPRFKNVCDVLQKENLHTIGYNAWCHTTAEMEFIKRRYADMTFVDADINIANAPAAKIKVLHRDIKFAGKSAEEKIALVQNMLCEHNADYYLFTCADSVSWLMNIYAKDLPYSPVVRAYALVGKNGKATLYADNLQTDIPSGNWRDFLQKMNNLGAAALMCDARNTPEKIKKTVGENTKMIKAGDICQLLKAEKNQTELQGMINCHIRDGAALSKFLCWLEENPKGLSELDIVQKLHEYRMAQEYFFSESFGTIAGFAQNGAIVHYQPSPKTNAVLNKDSLLLIDSGAQYSDGTTDVTRTIAIGEPSLEMIKDFTIVLKAHINLATAIFPVETAGEKLDILARGQLWQNGLDYKHGTGHGVACFGNVHEGPISISTASSDYGFKANMVVSDEPGIYKENRYGIRIENLLYTQESDYSGFLKFNILTKVPIDKRLIDKYMLTAKERAWLNEYHHKVYDCLASYMNEKEKLWLKNACSPL